MARSPSSPISTLLTIPSSKVAAFSVDGAYLKDQAFLGRSVVPFEQIHEAFPPERFDMFVAVSYSKLNALRSTKVASAKSMGYRLVSYLSSRATVFPDFALQENCFILEDNTI